MVAPTHGPASVTATTPTGADPAATTPTGADPAATPGAPAATPTGAAPATTPAPATTTPTGARPGPFRLLTALYADTAMAEIFGEAATIDGWLRAELALTRAEAQVGVVTTEDAEAIGAITDPERIDRAELWEQARNVGYPVLPLVRQLSGQLPAGPDGHVHWGATTQDIMDTGLVLQLVAAGDRMIALLTDFGDALAVQTEKHQNTVTAARTHAQQAVPTTFGTKLAVYLAQVTRDLERVRRASWEVRTLSLYGAGGTSAALGDDAAEVRRRMAAELQLSVDDIPWHVARDRLVEFGGALALAAGTAARIAREVVDLSRTEIAEVREADGHHRGASSTMPQKANPISSEAILGFSTFAATLLPALHRALEAGHERAAGEWQVEWLVLPELACSAASAVALAAETIRDLRVFADVMRANLDADGGLVLAEAYMFKLAPKLGREHAHDVVYDAARAARQNGEKLTEAIGNAAAADPKLAAATRTPIGPEQYLGETDRICEAALTRWATAKENA
ncbi:class-II fumarase/aspartase family protein [Cryptosporangium phraense]|uniref:Adenylosuccinate lyase family protein n=1 Tax=Cryptosporangium phraense TaxID=2593070 RepID=A0A545AJD6_9ACTN|nr:adenylosuccinate lyase family protein [Cryptosporangium phraense]TQS40805.1 adenylosuccinate lyase family protein [Cryptosporangium phraense]